MKITGLGTPISRLFVIGASAGGHRAIVKIFHNIAPSVPAAFLIVIHSGFDALSYFDTYLGKRIGLTVENASDNLEIKAGHIYLSVPNHHLFVQDSIMFLSNGPRENLYRPSIDVLFRSAAVSYQNKCVGILLTGRLNDGTAGLMAIKQCGGLTIIQDPKTAEFSEMPLTAQQEVQIDYTEGLEHIGERITMLCNQPLPPAVNIPEYIKREARIAMKIKSQIQTEESLGEQVPLSCSSCGGPLWKMNDKGVERYRCHVGHSFSQEALLYSQDTKLEETLWVSLRTFEEKKILLRRMIQDYKRRGFDALARSCENRIEEVSDHIDRLRHLMQLHD